MARRSSVGCDGFALTAESSLDKHFVQHEIRAMKNVTITVDEETARWARIEAARRETSVSRLVGELLREYKSREEGYNAAMKQYFSREPTPLKRSGSYPEREELHDRADLR